MNRQKLAALVEEATRLELLVSDLYALFHECQPADAAFWWTLSLEEKNHAALLKSGRDHFLPLGLFPVELIPSVLETLTARNNELEAAIARFRATPPSRQEALRYALALEESAAELHFQQALEEQGQSTVMDIFRTLNGEDHDHAERIRRYLEMLPFA